MTVPADKYQRRACQNPIRHSPWPMTLEKHHLQPRSWAGPDTPDNIVLICGLCHGGAHTALNACVAYGGIPPAEVWQRFHPYYRQLALEALRRAGGIVHKYTAPHPEAP